MTTTTPRKELPTWAYWAIAFAALFTGNIVLPLIAGLLP